MTYPEKYIYQVSCPFKEIEFFSSAIPNLFFDILISFKIEYYYPETGENWGVYSVTGAICTSPFIKSRPVSCIIEIETLKRVNKQLLDALRFLYQVVVGEKHDIVFYEVGMEVTSNA